MGGVLFRAVSWYLYLGISKWRLGSRERVEGLAYSWVLVDCLFFVYRYIYICIFSIQEVIFSVIVQLEVCLIYMRFFFLVRQIDRRNIFSKRKEIYKGKIIIFVFKYLYLKFKIFFMKFVFYRCDLGFRIWTQFVKDCELFRVLRFL